MQPSKPPYRGDTQPWTKAQIIKIAIAIVMFLMGTFLLFLTWMKTRSGPMLGAGQFFPSNFSSSFNDGEELISGRRTLYDRPRSSYVRVRTYYGSSSSGGSSSSSGSRYSYYKKPTYSYKKPSSSFSYSYKKPTSTYKKPSSYSSSNSYSSSSSYSYSSYSYSSYSYTPSTYTPSYYKPSEDASGDTNTYSYYNYGYSSGGYKGGYSSGYSSGGSSSNSNTYSTYRDPSTYSYKPSTLYYTSTSPSKEEEETWSSSTPRYYGYTGPTATYYNSEAYELAMAIENGEVDLKNSTDETDAFDSRVQEILSSGDPAAESYKLLENRYLKATGQPSSMRSITTTLILCLVILTMAFIIVYFIIERKRNALLHLQLTNEPSELTPVQNIMSQAAFEAAFKKGQIAVGQVVRAEDSDYGDESDEENRAESKAGAGTENDLVPQKGRKAHKGDLMKLMRPSSAVSSSSEDSQNPNRSIKGQVMGYGRGLFDVAPAGGTGHFDSPSKKSLLKKQKTKEVKGQSNQILYSGNSTSQKAKMAEANYGFDEEDFDPEKRYKKSKSKIGITSEPQGFEFVMQSLEDDLDKKIQNGSGSSKKKKKSRR